MDDAEPSFAAPPPGTQGRRDAAGAGGARESSRSQAASPNAARGAPASSQQSAPSSYQTRQPAAEPSSYQARQPAAEPSSYQARQPAAEPSYASSIDDDASDGDPRDADGSGFSSESADEGEAFASSAASDAAYYASAAVSGNAAQEAPAAAPAPTWTGEPGAPIRLDESWPALAARLPVRGIAAQLARQSELLRIDGNQFVLRVSARTLAEGQGAERLRSVLESHFGQPVRVSVEVGATGSDTAHAVEQSVRSARQQAAEEAILADPFVRTLMDNFGGQIVPNSISPVSPELPVKETPK
jgi:DNA polymerase-3 subunit gamma/tau